MQILRSDIYLLALLLPFNVLLKCKNIELAIFIAFGLLLMTPKESLAVILSASSTNLSMMQNVDESKQHLLHFDISNSSSHTNHNSSNGHKPSSSANGGGLIRCSNKLKCFDFNSSALMTRMRNGGHLSGKDNTYYESGNNFYEGNNHIGKFLNLKHLRRRRDHEANVIDTSSTLNKRKQQHYNIAQANNSAVHDQKNLIKFKNSLEDLQRNNSTSLQGNETSVDTTHSSYNGFLKLIFFISIIFVILLIIIASIIYIWVIRRFSTNLEQVNRGRLPEVNHNLLNHSSIQDFEALMLSVQNLGCAGMERLGSPPSNFATSCSPQRDNRSIRRPTNIPIMKHDLKVSSNRQPQYNNSTKTQHHQQQLQQLQQQSCYNSFNSGINNNNFSSSSTHQQQQQQHLSTDGNYHRNNHQYTSCTPNLHCPVHIQHPQNDGEFSRRIPSLDQCNDEIKRTYIQGPPNKTIKDVPDASDSQLPAYASLRYNNNNFCNNNLSNQKPSNSHNHHNNNNINSNNNHNSSSSSGGSGNSHYRSDKTRKTSSNFILDKLKFLRANSSTTNVKSVDYKAVHINVLSTVPSVTSSTTINLKNTNLMVHNSNSGLQQQNLMLSAQSTLTEESTERNMMFNGSTNVNNFSPSNLQVSSSPESSSRSLLSQTLSTSSNSL